MGMYASFTNKYILLMMLLTMLATELASSPLATDVHPLVRRGDKSPTPHEIITLALILGILGLVTTVLRYCNCKRVKEFHSDDKTAMVSSILFIFVLVLICVSAHFKTNLYLPEELAAILEDPADKHAREIGSKTVFAMEISMVIYMWAQKIGVWMFQWRICKCADFIRRVYLFLLVFIIIGFVIVEFSFFVLCRPLTDYFKIPVTNPQCATYHKYSLIQGLFNITTDVGLLLMPLSFVLPRQMSWREKIAILMVLAFSWITPAAAFLSKYFNFQSPFTTTYMTWYIIEASATLCAVNSIAMLDLAKFIAGRMTTWIFVRSAALHFGIDFAARAAADATELEDDTVKLNRARNALKIATGRRNRSSQLYDEDKIMVPKRDGLPQARPGRGGSHIRAVDSQGSVAPLVRTQSL